MNEEALKQRIQGNVLDTVHAGTAHMRSRAYFVLRAAAAITLAVLALALSGFVLSFIAFSIHESGELFLLGFGARGIAVFFNLFPWLSLMLDGVVILALEWLLAGFRFGYRVSLLSLLAAVFGASAVLAALVYALPIHSLLLDAADRGQLPILGGLYERIHESHIQGHSDERSG